jgi:Na+/H+-dicarboxylate symporter
MASLFIAEALGDPLSIGEQISLLLFMMIASKGAAGVTGAGMATLAGGLSTHRPELLDGVGLIVGIDRFMSEARALTNFAGNAIATVLIGHWTQGLDRPEAGPRARRAGAVRRGADDRRPRASMRTPTRTLTRCPTRCLSSPGHTRNASDPGPDVEKLTLMA